jgi:amino acid transporter
VSAVADRELPLRANAVGFFGVLAQSISDVAPSASVALLVPIVFVIAGAGAWLSWLIVTGVMLCVAFCCAEFTKRHATTGGLVGIVAGTRFKTTALAVSGCVLAFVLWTSSINVLGTGLLFEDWLAALGVARSRGLLVALVVLALALGFYISYRDIRISAIVMLAIEAFTLTALAILMIVILAENKHGNVFDSSQLALKGVSLHRVLLGSATAIFAVESFECSATLGQESRRALRIIPRSLFTSILLTGGIFTTASYVMTLGFEQTKASLATSTDPLSDLSTLYGVSWLRYVLLFGVAFSFFACLVAFTNWGARSIFTLARDGMLPKYFARVNRKTQTPARAVAALAALALVSIVTLVLLGGGTLRVWGYMATAGALMYITAYLLAMLALGAYGLETLKNVFMVIAAAIAVPTFAYVIYNALDPAPAYPLNLWTWIGVGISGMALLIACVLRMTGAPVMGTLGRSVQEDTLLAAADEANDDFSENGVDRSAASRRP